MTGLEQTTEELKEALTARAAMIAELSGAPPSEELAARLSAAIEAGDALRQALQSLKLRIASESRSLAQLRGRLLSGLGSAHDPRIELFF